LFFCNDSAVSKEISTAKNSLEISQKTSLQSRGILHLDGFLEFLVLAVWRERACISVLFAERILAGGSGIWQVHTYTLQHTATRCNTLQHTATPSNTLQHTATQFAIFGIHLGGLQWYIAGTHVLQHTATRSNTSQCTATHGNTWQRMATQCASCSTHLRRLQCIWLVHTRCNTLQHTATHCHATDIYIWINCNTLQHTATHCNILQHTAAHCNTLQHAAAHCDTLQHTAKLSIYIFLWSNKSCRKCA